MYKRQPNEPYMWRTGNPVGALFGYVADGFYTEEDFGENGKLVAGLPDPGAVSYTHLICFLN